MNMIHQDPSHNAHADEALDEGRLTEFPGHFMARIQGLVYHRVGEGPAEALPKGQEVEVQLAQASMVLSWTSDSQPVTVYLAKPEFQQYVDTGDIKILR